MLFFLCFKEIDYAMVARSENDLAPEKAGIPDTATTLQRVCSFFFLCSFYVLRENSSRYETRLIWTSMLHQKVLIPDFSFL